MLKAGAKVIISSPTPNNVFSSSGEYSWGPSRFDYYAWYASLQDFLRLSISLSSYSLSLRLPTCYPVAETVGRHAAAQLGGTAAGVYYVPHGQYAAQAMKGLGATVVNQNYPNDHTHGALFGGCHGEVVRAWTEVWNERSWKSSAQRHDRPYEQLLRGLPCNKLDDADLIGPWMSL